MIKAWFSGWKNIEKNFLAKNSTELSTGFSV
jgi:hypothetical protein